jgi:hypothetical protein
MSRVENGFATTIWSSKGLTDKLIQFETEVMMTTSMNFLVREMEMEINHSARERDLTYFGELEVTRAWIKLHVYGVKPTDLSAVAMKKFKECEEADGDLKNDAGLWKAVAKQAKKIKKMRCVTTLEWF